MPESRPEATPEPCRDLQQRIVILATPCFQPASSKRCGKGKEKEGKGKERKSKEKKKQGKARKRKGKKKKRQGKEKERKGKERTEGCET